MDGNSGLSTRISGFINSISTAVPHYLRTGDTRGFDDSVANIRQFVGNKYPDQADNLESLIESVGAMVQSLEPFKKQ